MILACDTSSVVCSVALAAKGEILFKKEAIGAQIHIEKLAPFLQEALEYDQLTEKSISALAIANGPGSFNGLRIGLATLKALALTLGLPLIPIPTTDAMAFGARKQLQGRCRAVIFSHRNFVHFADYDLEEKSRILTPAFHYSTWDKLYSDEIDHYFGTADRGFAVWLAGEEGARVQSRFHQISAHAGPVALLAGLRKDQTFSDPDSLEPFYNVQYEAKKWTPPTF